ncbi:glycosyltransferase family 39 protein [Chelativorans alearense]|uniref:glycosyltransferase family 39 protein n=1 Tax=Chelativorans alearense TaxID=2681495 RepID=UPI0013D26395|nr:glycosyltransferase family 39 protein [Chelativorans alearense]
MVPGERQDRSTQLAAAALAGLLLAGLAVRFYRLDAQSLWLDELWTVAASDPSLTFGQWINQWILPDVHPPLHHLVMRAWRVVFGVDEWSLRLSSAVTSALCVAVVPLIQRWTPVVRRPLALATWLATSTGAIVYAQEVRAYALLLLLTTAAICLSVAIARRIEQRERVLAPAAILAAVTVMLEYTHYFGVLVVAGLFGALFLFAAAHRDRPAIGAVVVMGSMSMLAFLPWMLFHVPHLGGLLGGKFWIANNWHTTFTRLAGFAAGVPAVFAALAVLVVGSMVRRPQMVRKPEYFVPLVAMGTILAGALLISLHTPVITDRNLFVLLPPFYVLAIAAVGDLEDIYDGAYRQALLLLPAAVAAISLGAAIYWLAKETKEQWREAAALITTLPGCDRGPLPVNNFPKEIYAYYMPPGYRERLIEVSATNTGRLPVSPSELVHRPCPLLLWNGNSVRDEIVAAWIDRLGLDRQDVVVRKFERNMVILARRDDAAPASLPAGVE